MLPGLPLNLCLYGIIAFSGLAVTVEMLDPPCDCPGPTFSFTQGVLLGQASL